jgi:hypothetical protein
MSILQLAETTLSVYPSGHICARLKGLWMSRRRNYRNRDYDDYRDYDRRRDYNGRRKSRDEERIERLTWFFLVMVIAIIHVFREGGMTLSNWIIPFSGSVVLLGSGLVQYTRRWHVSPATWLGGALLAGLALINLYVSPGSSFFGISLIVFAVVILIGLLTGET